MIGSFVIVFREILEASLVVGVVAAAVEGLPYRGRWVSAGVALGIAGALLVAAGIGEISRFADGSGQEVFAAAVLFAAGLMLAWHNVWMARHGRNVAKRLKTLGDNVLAGNESLVMLVGVTALAVMREGSEIALFLYGIAASGVNNIQLLGGSLLGLAAGVATGLLLFAGLSRIPMKRLFQVSGWIILFIASGMVARGAQFLVQAGLLPALAERVWNSSDLIAGNGILGRSLGALVGYTPAPSLMQLLFWIVSFIVIGGLMLAGNGRLRALRSGVAAAALLVLYAGAGLLLPRAAHAGDYQVYSPHIVLGENELEARGFTSWGTGPHTGAGQGLKFAFGHAFTSWWASEVYAEAEQEYGESLKLEEFEWENRFQLTPQGRYWVDVGFMSELEIPRFGDDPYQLSLGPTFEKDFGRWTVLLNTLVVQQFGTNAASGVGLEYRARLEYRWRRGLSPIIEAYGEPAGNFGGYDHPRHQIGPGVTGQIPMGGVGNNLRYGLVALFGENRNAPDSTLVLRLEYEFY